VWPGGLTRLIVSRGVQVKPIDAPAAMVRVERRAAPGASYEQADAREFEPVESVDVIARSFHELPAAELPGFAGILSGIGAATSSRCSWPVAPRRRSTPCAPA
jgi:hypothetical protein